MLSGAAPAGRESSMVLDDRISKAGQNVAGKVKKAAGKAPQQPGPEGPKVRPTRRRHGRAELTWCGRPGSPACRIRFGRRYGTDERLTGSSRPVGRRANRSRSGARVRSGSWWVAQISPAGPGIAAVTTPERTHPRDDLGPAGGRSPFCANLALKVLRPAGPAPCSVPPACGRIGR